MKPRILTLSFLLTGALLAQSYNASNLSNSVHLIKGTVVPASCAANDMFLKMDATPPQNLYICPAGTFVLSTGVSVTPSGAAGGDLLGSTYPNPVVATVGGVTAANVASGANLANAATTAATNNTIAKRDGTGGLTAVQLNGSGAGLSASSVPITALAAGDFSSRINAGTYSINISGTAGSVAWGNVSSHPVNLSQFVNDVGFITAGGTASAVAWSGVTTKPATWLDGINLAAPPPADINTGFASGFYSSTGVTNAPVAGWFTTIHGRSQNTGNYAFDLLFPHGTENLYFRAKNDTTTGTWRQVLLEDGRTYGVNISGNAAAASSVSWSGVSGRPTSLSGFINDISAVLSTGSYTDPAWLTLTKGKVGLSNVENTALSTWAGSANITTLGTIASGAIPWTLVTGKPTAVSAWTNDAGYITSSASISGNAATVSNGVYTNAQNVITAAAVANVPLALKPVASTGTGHLVDFYNNAASPAITSYVGPDGLFYGSGAGLTASTVPIAAHVAGDYSSKINAGTYSINVSGNAATVTNGLYSTGSYSDPAWLTISKSKVGLGNVENTALSGWAGTSNITTVGTLSAGTVPWARLSGIPSTFAPSAHTHVSADVTDATNLSTANMLVKRDGSGNFSAGTITAALSGNATTASALAADPTDCTGNNWARGINAAGTAQCAQPDFSNLSGTVSIAQHAAGDYSSKITSGTYSVNISGNAATATTATTANGVAWTNVSGRPTNVSSFTNDANYQNATYIQSRGMNLFTNGSGLQGTNYNLSGFTFDQTDTHGGKGSFKRVGNANLGSDELIPVDPTRTYKMSLWAKSTVRGTSNIVYFGITPYDVDGNAITSTEYQRVAGTDTTLAQALNPGDTTVKLTSAANWNNGSTPAYLRSFYIWKYSNSFGYMYPPYTYSRKNVYLMDAAYSTNGVWAAGGISGNTITLTAPWPAGLGTWPAGTPVSNASAGGTYKYIAAGGADVPNAWTNYSGTIGGVDVGGTNNGQFPPGTAGMKLLFLLDYSSGGSTTNISDLWVSELTTANLEYAASGASGILSSTAQTISGAKTFDTSITAPQFNGSGAGLTASTVPIASLVAGDYSSRINAGTYSINISGTAASASSVAWGNVSGRPTALSGFTDDLSNAAASNSTLVKRNASGYVYANYFNMTADVTASAASHIAVQVASDGFIRWRTPANIKTDLGMSNVENTALSTWAGTSSITTIGTLAAGTVPWARLSGIPGTFTPAAHTHLTADIADATNANTANMLVKRDPSGGFSAGPIYITTAADASPYITPRMTIYKDASNWGYFSYGADAILRLVYGKSAAGGLMIGQTSANDGTGTFASKLSLDAAGNATFAGTVTAPTFSGSLSGNATTATTASAVAWTNVTGRPTALSSFINDSAFITAGASISGNAATATTSSLLTSADIRTMAPSNLATAKSMQFGFTAWNNNNTGPYADYLHMRSYQDASGGNDNLVMFRKDAIGMRIWQQTWGSATAYATYKDIAFTDGTNATGTWGISISGNAATATTATTAATANAVTWANVSGKPTAVSTWTNDAGYLTSATSIAISQLTAGDYSSKITSGSYGISVTGSAGSVAWANVSSKPTTVSAWINDSGYYKSADKPNFAGYARITNTSGAQSLLLGNQDSAGVNKPSVIQASNGDIYLGYGNTWTAGGGVFTTAHSFFATGAVTHVGAVTATQFNGSGAGLSAGSVPITSLVAGDYSSKINAGTYSIAISGNAATASTAATANAVAWANVTGKPTAVSSFTNDSAYITLSSVTWTNVTGKPTALSAFTNDSGYITSAGNAATVTNGVYINGQNVLQAAAAANVPLAIKPVATTGTGHLLDLYNNAASPAIASYFGSDGILYGSGAGLASGSVPIAAHVAGDYSSKINAGTYSISISGTAATATTANSVAWTNVSGKPTTVSSFTNDAGYLIASGTIANATNATTAATANAVAWANVTGKPTALSSFTNDSAFITLSSVTWVNLTGKPTAVSSFTNDSGYITSAGNAATVTNGVYTNAQNIFQAAAAANVPLALKPVASTGTGHLVDFYNNAASPAVTSYIGPDGVFYGSGTGLTASTVPIAALVAGDYSTKINAGTYSINISGTAATATTANGVAWANVSGRPTGVSSFTNDSAYITLSPVTWANVSGKPTAVSSFTNDSGYLANNAASYSVAAGNGNGFCFWGSATACASGTMMGNSTAYTYGPVTDYSIRTVVDANPGRGFTWGVSGGAIIAGLNALTGNMQIAGTMTATQFNGSGADISSGTIPIASLVAGDYSSRITSGTYAISVSGNAATATTATSANSVAWASVSGKPTAVSSFTNDSGYITNSITGAFTMNSLNNSGLNLIGVNPTITSGDNLLVSTAENLYLRPPAGYSVLIDGTNNGLSVTSNISTSGQFNGSGAGLSSGTVPIAALAAGDYSSKLTSGSYAISVTGGAAYLTGLGVCSTSNCSTANQVVRTDGNGYTNLGWINTMSGDNGTTAMSRVYASQDGYIRYYTPAEAHRQMSNSKGHQLNFTFGDGVNAITTVTNLPVTMLKNWGLTVTKASCMVDSGTVNLTMTSTTNGMTTAPTACTSAGVDTTTGFNGYATIANGSWMGFTTTIASGTPKYLHVTVTYTQN